MKILCHHQSFFLINTFKVALQYPFNIVIPLNTGFFYLKLNFKLKIDPKTCNLKSGENLPKYLATLKQFVDTKS